jgi:dihydropteroate synthase
MKSYTLSWDSHTLELGKTTRVMGILNATPDSFSDGGRFFTFDRAVAHGERLAAEGADIIDIGGESTRPFSASVSEEEESRRVVPVIETLAKRISVPISIDTVKAGVARRALDAGASIINDISAMHFDPAMTGVAAKYGVPVILMHMQGTPETMQVTPAYDDIVAEIKIFLQEAVDRAENSGVPRARIIVDPGIGFGKTFHHNLFLVNHLDQFESLDVPVLVGPSRKAFIRNILKDTDARDMRADAPIVETGTQAVVRGRSARRSHREGPRRRQHGGDR